MIDDKAGVISVLAKDLANDSSLGRLAWRLEVALGVDPAGKATLLDDGDYYEVLMSSTSYDENDVNLRIYGLETTKPMEAIALNGRIGSKKSSAARRLL